ncbi:Protein CL16A [Modicella reniformis]|uniref:Protein CL16A n=1 Tax=Modicella reniformis TaxID=1440133 RepID=A0A9P6MJI8_9FUNG|nr:Protein CL16A [Modicella reniformis]
MFRLLWKPKPERFSLDNLISLCGQLQQDTNEERIINCLKELTQLLIWGDQHDPNLLEHFFEREVHYHFLTILKSKRNVTIIVQVLQTLNIMFENVRSKQSLYFLLSNNYVNQIICLKYDFSNDEILAYYIYLLRTLSFKLSKDTIYFFFNEGIEDFPLYSEAIKFFNHDESMIRIAVRVITLNVYSVNNSQIQDFILDRTTTTYFSNLVWYIGNYGTAINDMLLHPGEGETSRISYYLAEHMDCFYYVNDIIELEVPKVNKLLISHLLNRLLRPMYLDSLLPPNLQGASTNKSSSYTPTQ